MIIRDGTATQLHYGLSGPIKRGTDVSPKADSLDGGSNKSSVKRIVATQVDDRNTSVVLFVGVAVDQTPVFVQTKRRFSLTVARQTKTWALLGHP